MAQGESFDVVLRALGSETSSAPRLLEDVLGLEPSQTETACERLPAVVIAGTTRAHADIAVSLLRDAGASADVIAHGAPLEAQRPAPRRRGSIREVVEERQVRHRDAAEERPTRPLVDPRAEPSAGATSAAAAGFSGVQAAPITPALVTNDAGAYGRPEGRTPGTLSRATPSGTDGTPSALAHAAPNVQAQAPSNGSVQAAPQGPTSPHAPTAPALDPVFPEPAPHTGAGLFAATPMIDFASPAQPAPDTDLLGSAFGSDSAFGPLDLEAGRASHQAAAFAAGPATKPTPSKGDDELESLFQAPRSSFDARQQARVASAAASVESSARARLAGKASKPASTAAAPSGELVMLAVRPPARGWFGRVLSGAAFLAVVGVAMAFLTDSGDAEAHAGTARGEGTRPGPTIHPVVRLTPRGLDSSMGAILRRLVDGLHPVMLDMEGMPKDTQCLLVRTEDGKGEARLEKLLRTGLVVPLDEARQQAMAEHEEGLRVALNEPDLTFEPLCLSVDAWAEREAARRGD